MDKVRLDSVPGFVSLDEAMGRFIELLEEYETLWENAADAPDKVVCQISIADLRAVLEALEALAAAREERT